MFILGLQLHWVTLSIVTLELLLFVGQAVGFLCRPQDKKLGWQLLLLILVILRNTVEGLFQTPNPSLWIPILWQNFFAHGFGYVVASYFPLYWYKTLDLPSLKFHAWVGFFFLLTPVILVYGLFYPVSQDIMSARTYVYVIPCLYGICMLVHIFRAIRNQYAKDKNKLHRQMRVVIFLAIVPWMTAPLIGVGLGQPQWVIDITLNTGFLILNVLFIRQVVKQSRADLIKIKELETKLELHRFSMTLSQENVSVKKSVISPSISPMLNLASNKKLSKKELFELACGHWKLSPAEIRVVEAFISEEGLSQKMIADKLNIDRKTVETHTTSIYKKAGIQDIKGSSSKRKQLLEKLSELQKSFDFLPPLGIN